MWFRKADGQMTAGDPPPNGSGSKETFGEFKPDEFKKELDTTIENKLKALQEANDAKMAPLLEMAENAKKAREAEEAERARKAAEARNSEEGPDFLLDPRAAVRKELQPVAQYAMGLAAKQAKAETLENEPFYTGVIKEKVDAMLAQQPLENQVRPDVIKNCYKVVAFDHQKEIQEGKIKSRNASSVFESNGTGAPSGEANKTVTLTPEEKASAKVFGMTDQQWLDSKKELSYV